MKNKNNQNNHNQPGPPQQTTNLTPTGENETGKPQAGPAIACVKTSPQEKEALAKSAAETLAVLETHRLKWCALADTRPSGYLHQLARHSAEQLDTFLTLIFAPGRAMRATVAKCPLWPPGSKHEGHRPTLWLVWSTTKRLNALRGGDHSRSLNKTIKEHLENIEKLPHAQRNQVTEFLCTLLAQELLSEKLDLGIKVSTQTKALDSLLRKQKLDLEAKAQEYEVKDDQARALKWTLEEAEKYPAVAKMFQVAYEALREARRQS